MREKQLTFIAKYCRLVVALLFMYYSTNPPPFHNVNANFHKFIIIQPICACKTKINGKWYEHNIASSTSNIFLQTRCRLNYIYIQSYCTQLFTLQSEIVLKLSTRWLCPTERIFGTSVHCPCSVQGTAMNLWNIFGLLLLLLLVLLGSIIRGSSSTMF